VQVEPVVDVDRALQVAVTLPSPPPSWPTITSDVSGTAAGKLLVRVIVKGPAGTVITTGDQVPAAAFVFEFAHVAGATAAAVQL
jgi:hypothetical protein